MPIQSFSFPILDTHGQKIRQAGIWGTLGFKGTFKGTIDDQDQCIIALRELLNERRNLSPESQLVVRSFALCWLTSFQPQLSAVVSFAVPLPDSVLTIEKIGLLDRTAKKVVLATSSAIATTIFLNSIWKMATVDFQSMCGIEAAAFVIEQGCSGFQLGEQIEKIQNALDSQIGLPGTATPRSAFDATVIYDFLKLCRFRAVLRRIGWDAHVTEQMVLRLDARILSLFLANSRQIEGLVLSGSSESSAAIAAHAALALGLSRLTGKQQDEIFQAIEGGIAHVTGELRRAEAQRTLSVVRENQSGKAAELERRLRWHLSSAMTTEAVDMAAYPVATTFEFLGSIADGVEKHSSNSTASKLLSATGEGFRVASRTVDATPDAISKIIKGGVVAEAWIRNMSEKIWPFGLRRG